MTRATHTFLTLAALVLWGCGPEPTKRAVGADGWGPSLEDGVATPQAAAVPRAKAIPPEERKRWSRAGELDALEKLDLQAPSHHIDGTFERTVAVNAAGSVYGTLTMTTVVPAGAMIVQRHHKGGEKATSVIYVMEKLEKGKSPTTMDWKFLVVDNALRVAANKNLDLCARCHVDAPYQGLFGIAVPLPDQP